MKMGFCKEAILGRIQDWMKGLREQKAKGQEWSLVDKRLLAQIMFLGVPTNVIEDNLVQTGLLIGHGIKDAETVFIFNELSAELDRRESLEG